MKEITKKEICESNVPVLIEFYGKNCNACKDLEPLCDKLSREYDGKLNFAKSDLHTGGIAQEYQVKNSPFFVIVQDGKLVTRFPGLTGNASGNGRDYKSVSEEYIKRQIERSLSTIQPKEEMKLESRVEKFGKFSDNAIKVLERRYLKRNEAGEAMENYEQLFRRVASSIASVDERYGKSKEEVAKLENEFYQMMVDQDFMPNSPTLMNAGKGEGQLSACFVLPILDDMRSIAYNVGNTAMIHKSGGGTGFSFSRLRPEDDFVTTTYGRASGPISFLDATDRMTEAVNQGGFRRGANMGILRVDHPDIIKFIKAKDSLDLKNRDVYNNFEKKLEDICLDDSVHQQIMVNLKKSLSEKQLNNFNLSVAITDEFMKAVKENRDYDLINPKNGKVVRKENAQKIFNLIAEYAWKNGEPGVVFIDRLNEYNPTPAIGEIESTNPCGEQPLLPYEACNLGSVNLGNMVVDGKIDYNKLGYTLKKSVRFLDNVIDKSEFPDILHVDIDKEEIVLANKIRELVNSNRKIGMGIMGFSDMLIRLGIPYNSDKSLEVAEEIMKFVRDKGREASVELANERGVFPNFKNSIYDKESKYFKGEDFEFNPRNATITTIAPTGSISMIADCSSGIEPLFEVAYTKTVMDGTKLNYLHPDLEKKLKEEGLYSEEIIKKISKNQSLKGLDGIPEHIKKLFVTTADVSFEHHVKMQAAIQKFTDNAVSKTINFPFEATIEDFKKAYTLAYDLKCKGLTGYRDGSRDEQVLSTESTKKTRARMLEELIKEDHNKIDRPSISMGPMVKIPIGKDEYGKDRSAFVYLGANDKGRMVDGFIITGKSGGVITAQNEAIGRLISEMFQDGKNPARVANMLSDIKGDSPGYEEKVVIHSSPDGVAKILNRYVNGDYLREMESTVNAYRLRYGQNQKIKEVEEPEKKEIEKKEQDPDIKKVIKEKKPCPNCKDTEYNILRKEGCSYFSCCGHSLKGCD